jgi:hypothetical protein
VQEAVERLVQAAAAARVEAVELLDRLVAAVQVAAVAAVEVVEAQEVLARRVQADRLEAADIRHKTWSQVPLNWKMTEVLHLMPQAMLHLAKSPLL